MESLFLISFLVRYWKLHIAFVTLVLIGHYDKATYFVGPIFYVFMLVVGCIEAALLVKHMVFRNTLERFTEEPRDGCASEFASAWRLLEPSLKVKLTVFVLCTFFLGAAWIAASIAK